MTNRHYRQEQFLNVIDRDEAERLFLAAIDCMPREAETIDLRQARGRVLAAEILAPIDVPNFDRSNVDGYAVQASSTIGAREDAAKLLKLVEGAIQPGRMPDEPLSEGRAWAIATGAAVPRQADAVVMVEHTDIRGDQLEVFRPVAPGGGISFAGSDLAMGEVVLRRGDLLTSRETGVLAALGIAEVSVYRKPLVAVISTGNELLRPGVDPIPGYIFDSNSQILCDAIKEAGGDARSLGIVQDDEARLREVIAQAIEESDAVLLSGGTSKGAGDLCYRVVRELTSPGILAHGVALKPGKPICLATHGRKPVVILPGFPTSAVFTFHEFVAPVIRRMAGLPAISPSLVSAKLPVRVNSEIGRTEYLLVGLVQAEANQAPHSNRPFAEVAAHQEEFIAFPMGKGSGSVTAFSRADGFITIDRQQELLDAGQTVQVQLIGNGVQAADLVVIGSHCPGLDKLLSRVQQQGFRSKFLAVGSTAGLQAAQRGECDLAGIHLLDAASGEYNRPFVTPELTLLPGYARRQGIVFRADDARFADRSPDEILALVARDETTRMVNRNTGSGTRILLDGKLSGVKPPGYAAQVSSHNAVAAAVAQGRADWGVAIQAVAAGYHLGFAPLAWERFDFVTPTSRAARPAVACLNGLLNDDGVRAELTALGFSFAA